MAEKLEDLNLPTAVISRLLKNALPEVNVGKEAKIAVGKAASMFVLYLTSAATNVAQTTNRKTMTPQDVIDALSELEFDDFIPHLKEVQEEYKNAQKKKKEGLKGKPKETEDAELDAEADADGDEDLEMEEDQSEDI